MPLPYRLAFWVRQYLPKQVWINARCQKNSSEGGICNLEKDSGAMDQVKLPISGTRCLPLLQTACLKETLP